MEPIALFRVIAISLILMLLPSQADSFSTEGCRGRKDPYRGKPSKPKRYTASGALSDHLVALDDSIAGLKLDLKYKTKANFTGRSLYPASAKCWVRPRLAQAIKAATKRLSRGGFGLILYDCYRPWAVQVDLWKACPKRGLVGDPTRGSHHNRGAAVDVGLYRLGDGRPLEMPTAFDDLSHRARHNYQGGSAQSREHRRWLLVTMQKVGLRPIGSEWWHYQLTGARHLSVLDVPLGPRQ